MINFTILVILVLPIAFQLIFGNRGTKGVILLSFWKVSLISLFGQVFSVIWNFYLVSELITLSKSRNGWPGIGILILESIAGLVLVIVILSQRYIQYRKAKLSKA